jgi:N-acetylglutamate synthase-like GNAT family acetyltransferase
MVPRGQVKPAVGRQKESLENRTGCQASVRLIVHTQGARALRLGLGPGFRPAHAIRQLQQLMNGNAFWAQGRSLQHLRHMVKNSAVCVTAWQGNTLVGFGRATSDGIYRATIWDLVVNSEVAGRGVGRALVESLMESPVLARCERVYLMTTNGAEFYKKMGFEIIQSQVLMMKKKSG